MRQDVFERRQIGIALADDGVGVRVSGKNRPVTQMQQDRAALVKFDGLIEILEITEIEKGDRGPFERAVMGQDRAQHQSRPLPIRPAQRIAELQSGPGAGCLRRDKGARVRRRLADRAGRGRKENVPVLIGDRHLLDLTHPGDAPAQPIIVSATVDWRLGTQRQKRLDRTAQDKVDGLDGAAGLFGEDHIETGHLVLGIGEDRGAAG